MDNERLTLQSGAPQPMDKPAPHMPRKGFERSASTQPVGQGCVRAVGGEQGSGGPAAPGTSPGGDAGRSFKSHFSNPVGGPENRLGSSRGLGHLAQQFCPYHGDRASVMFENVRQTGAQIRLAES